MAKRTEVLVAKFWKQIAYLTLVTTVIWTIVTVWGAWVNKAKSDIKPEVLAPLNPTIETKTLEQLRTRVDTTTLIQGFVAKPPSSSISSPGL